MAQPSLGSHYVEFSIALGAIVALGVVLFNITQGKLPSIHRSSPVMIPISIVAFTLVGVMAMYFPEILGNGKAGNELTFTNDIHGRMHWDCLALNGLQYYSLWRQVLTVVVLHHL